MKLRSTAVVWSVLAAMFATSANALDWPQWRGPNRDGMAAEFQAPKTWPKELKKGWSVPVGEGVATPALVGGRLYVFGREDGQEVVRCLNANSGKEIWKDKYESGDADGAAARFPVLGPRSSPAVADGKVVTLGTRGTLSCYDADKGKLLWRNDEFHAWPRFFVSSSPLITDGLCIAQLGSERGGGIVAYNLATGQEKWKWTGDGPAYGSPVLAKIGDTQAVIAPTAGNLVALDASNGDLLWEQPYSQGRYNAATPIVAGQTLIFAGPTRGMTAKKLVAGDKKLAAEDLWSNPDNSVMYDTPVDKNGLLFGLSNLNSLFCIDTQTGKTVWNAPVNAQAEAGNNPQRPQGGQQGRGRRGRRGGGGSGGYGSVVAAGDVLLALTPAGELIVFEPSDQDFKQLARYKVADGNTYSYPVVSGNRLFIKDKDSLTLWTLQ